MDKQQIAIFNNRIRVLEHENRSLKKEVDALKSSHKIMKTLLSKSRIKL